MWFCYYPFGKLGLEFDEKHWDLFSKYFQNRNITIRTLEVWNKNWISKYFPHLMKESDYNVVA